MLRGDRTADRRLEPSAGHRGPHAGTDRVLPVHGARGERGPVGDQLRPRPPWPVGVGCRAGRLRLLGRADRRPDRPGPARQAGPAQTVIGGGLLLAIAATGLIWWQPGAVVVVLAFVVLGAALAGVFPALIAVTPQRIGEERAQHAIAWQVGAAAAGGSGISAVIGLLIDTTSLAVLGPALVVLALLLLAANAALARLAPIPTERLTRGSARG